MVGTLHWLPLLGSTGSQSAVQPGLGQGSDWPVAHLGFTELLLEPWVTAVGEGKCAGEGRVHHTSLPPQMILSFLMEPQGQLVKIWGGWLCLASQQMPTV